VPLTSLWRGTLPSAIRTGAGSALYFGGLDVLRRATASGNRPAGASGRPQLTNTANLLTGALARAAAGFVMMPVTVIKVRYESSLYAYSSMYAACTDIYKGSGLRGFFAGSGATAVRDAPYAGLYVLFYESLKSYLAPSSVSSAGVNFVSGSIAAATATAVTNPFDAIKTRLQLRPTEYRSLFRAGHRIVSEEGWKSLFDGLGLRMVRKGMSSALAWTVYEELVKKAEVVRASPGHGV